MGRWTTRLGDDHVTVRCDDAGADLVPPLLSLLTELHRRGELVEGTTLRWGWSVLVLRQARDGRLELCEPDFSGDPAHQLRPDVSATLTVQARTRELLARSGLPAEPVRFDESVVVAGDALSQRRVLATRGAPAAEGVTGWYVGSRPGFEDDRISTCRVFELLTARPALLPVLALPTGSLAVVDDDVVTRVVDDRNRTVLATDGGLGR